MNQEIAVIVPVYNTGKAKLSACIQSILRQMFQNLAVVLVDDGSTDDSGAVCDAYAKKDHRITVIHQPNKGSVEARKAGILSETAQQAKYICMCDSDDTMPNSAMEKMYNAAVNNDADCVCGVCKRYTGGGGISLPLPERFCAPCFDISQEKLYTHDAIIRELYISCFGISNYPVSLWAKLYKTNLITQATAYDPIVHFMGEDLSVTLRVLPETQRLVIIPDIVYHYRIGGGTSRYMPFMLEDFLSLYRFKKEMAEKYPMPQNADYFMAVEMKNILLSWLEMCAVHGEYSKDALLQEAARVCRIPEIQDAVGQKDFAEKQPDGIRKAIQNVDAETICSFVYEQVNAGRFRRFVKSILK